MNNWVIFLTVWLLVQMTLSVSFLPEKFKLMGKNQSCTFGGILGTMIKYIGIFVCLIMGGFYDTGAL